MTSAKLDRSLTYRLHLLHKVSDQVSHQAYIQDLKLSLSEGRCLATVGAFEPMSIMALADKGNLNKGQASRAAQGLVDLGLIAKTGDPEDGRGIQLTLTAKGRRLWKKTMDLIDQRNQAIFGCLSAQERQTFSQLLDRLVEHNVNA
ncbi:MAG: winged helix-turn-helix transcriptional regulator [Limnohabitans sp.]|jgi:DNA-binding MarR family transcriptional regulator|nr:winged helix-turn-helix transcriptional regulator [Limnohabitans sp.]